MGLGNRGAKRHQTARTAGVNSEDYRDFQPGQVVMTVDGFLGTVEAVVDGPAAGIEEYEVALVNGLGGGRYTASQLRASSDRMAKTENTAAKDYPELAEILAQRPDPGKYPESTLGLIASRQDPQDDSEAMRYHGRDDVTELREDLGLPPLEAAYYTEDELREIGRAAEEREGKSAAEMLAAQAATSEAPGLCENGHLTWGGDCPACRNADDGQNAMVVNPGDHKPQDTENQRNAARKTAEFHDLCEEDEDGYCHYHHGYHDDDAAFEDEDAPSEQMVHCQNCGQWKGAESGYHPGNDGPCPSHRPSEDEVFDSLDPSKYCGEHCQSAHAADIVQGVGGHHTFRVGEPEYAEHGTGLPHSYGPHDVPPQRGDSSYEVRDPDAAGLCHYCRSPLPDSPLRALEDIGNPSERHFLTTNPTGPSKYSSVEKTAQWYYQRSQVSGEPIVHAAGTPLKDGRRGLDVGDHVLFDSGHSARIHAVSPTLLLLEGHSGPMHRGPIEGNFSNVVYSSDSVDQAGQDVPGMNERQRQFLDSNTTGPTKYSSVSTERRTEPRVVTEDDDFDPYLVTRCTEHGIKSVGDRASQEHYISVAGQDHDDAHTNRDHLRTWHDDGSDCWSCCPEMYVAKPGERTSGRIASLNFGLAMMAVASRDPELGFHVTATWADVRSKARRLRTEGRVHITTAQNGYVIAQVKGDHGTYESVLMRVPGTQKVGQWDCGCKWAEYHWGAPDDYSRFAGRMCSHALALHFEAQSRGMFGREVKPDQKLPRWLTQDDVERTASTDLTFAQTFAAIALAAGESADRVRQVLASVNSPFGEPSPNAVPHFPATMPRNPAENPASAGFLTAADPEGWNDQNPQDLGDRIASFFDAKGRRTDVCANCDRAIHDGGGIDPNVPWVHAETGNAYCDVDGPGDATLLAGSPLERPEAHPTVHEASRDDEALFEPEMGRAASESTLHDAPEPALPSTDGAAEDDDTTYSGYAGDPNPDQQVTAAAIDTGVGYSVPSDVSANSAMDVNPGPGLKDVDDDALSPEDPSVQVTGSVADIVAQFQATAAAQTLQGGPAAAQADTSEIAQAAKAFLSKEAMAVFSPAEQQALINEGENVRAANLDRLQIEGTHYEALEHALASAEDDDESWMS